MPSSQHAVSAMWRVVLGLALALLGIGRPAVAQIASLTDLPTWKENDRFFSNVISDREIKNPSLSLNGFDNGGYNARGYDLRQVLVGAYGSVMDLSLRAVIDRLQSFALVEQYYPSPTARWQVIQNSSVIQARAFIALAAYILHQNGNDEASFFEVSHTVAFDSLRSALADTASWSIYYYDSGFHGNSTKIYYDDDAVKWTTHVGSMARALDLYLALENAYEYYGLQGDATSLNEYQSITSTRLLTRDEKEAVFQRFYRQITSVDYLAGEDFFPFPGLDRYDVEVGNFGIKVKAALGYGALVVQDVNAEISPTYLTERLSRAFDAALRPSSGNRHHNYRYQTKDGKRFFAEGAYYFHFALKDLIPFWHAIRINSMLDWHASFDAPDPFNTAEYVTPLEWLADVVTPDGSTPPLDDGNKAQMENTSILRWASYYGNAAVGQKFAWINDLFGFASQDELLPVEIAIPRLGVDQGTKPGEGLSGNTLQTHDAGEDGDQQVILRHGTTSNACDDVGNSGDCHYVLLNGESGRAYTGGEGHEQPDQMQLLYYIDDVSFLMDSGYDRGQGLQNSTWNHYGDHNVMTSYAQTGSPLPPPELVAWGKSINAIDAASLYGESLGSVQRLHGSQPLAFGWYERDVFFIDGSEPYLIDLNRMGFGPAELNLRYHANAAFINVNNFDPNQGRFVDFSSIRVDAFDDETTPVFYTSKKLYLYPVGIEAPAVAGASGVRGLADTARERKGVDRDIFRLDIPHPDDAEAEFSVATIIQAKDVTPSYEPKLLWSDYATQYQRGWVWQQDATTLDVFIGRSIESHTQLTLATSLQSADPSFPDISVVLPPDEDYGFARFIEQNGEWGVAPGYQVHLLAGPPTLNFTQNETITQDVGFFSGQTVTVQDHVTVTFDGDVFVDAGVTFQLGKYAKIIFNGTVTTEGTQASPVQFDRLTSTSGNPTVEFTGTGSRLQHVAFAGGNYYAPTVVVRGGGALTVSDVLFDGRLYVKDNAHVTVEAGSSYTCNYSLFIEDTGTVIVGADATFKQLSQIYLYEGGSMTIHEGVDVRLRGDILGDGHLDILGTANNKVTFGPYDVAAWGYILYRGPVSSGTIRHAVLQSASYGVFISGADNIQVENVTVQYAGGFKFAGLTVMWSSGSDVTYSRFSGAQHGLFVNASQVNFPIDNHFTDNDSTGMWIKGGSNVDFGTSGGNADVKIVDNARQASVGGYGIKIEGSSTAVLGILDPPFGGNNAIFDNGAYDIYVVDDATSSGVGAQLTWWGEPGGPPDPDRLSSPNQYAIDYSNWLTQNPYLNLQATHAPLLASRSAEPALLEGPDASSGAALQPAGSLDTPADLVRWMHRLRAQHGRATAERTLATYTQAREDWLAQTARRLRLPDLVLLGRADEAIGEATTLLNNQTLSRVEKQDVLASLFLAHLEGRRDVQAAAAVLDQLKRQTGSEGLVAPLESLLQDRAQQAEVEAQSPLGDAGAQHQVPAPASLSTQQDLTVSSYPNPFNPVATIRYTLPEQGHVNLTVYDVLGRRVALLVDDKQRAGWHEASFDASHLATGVYLYRLEAAGQVQSGRMLLVK